MSILQRVRDKITDRSDHTYAIATRLYMGEAEYAEFIKESEFLCLYGRRNDEAAFAVGEMLFGLRVIAVKQPTYLEVA